MWMGTGEHRVVGDYLAEARRNRGLTQTQLAVALGKPQSFVSSYERGQRRVDLIEFAAIAYEVRIDPKLAVSEILDRVLAFKREQAEAVAEQRSQRPGKPLKRA